MGPQYTRCVAPADFVPAPGWVIYALAGVVGGGALTWFAIAAKMSALAGSLLVGWGLLVVLLEALYAVVDWMLNGKLICLKRDPADPCTCDGGGQVCAIGEVGDIEEVGEDKNLISGIDNDYCINLILGPVGLARHLEYAKNGEDYNKNYALAQAGPQGDLITVQQGMPTDDAGNPMYGGYDRTFVMLRTSQEYSPWTEIVGHSGDAAEQNEKWTQFLLQKAWLNPKKYRVPVLHCEFEGSRIRDILDAIEFFSFGGKWCKKNWFFKLICHILRALLAPVIALAVLAAWVNASAGSQTPALADPAAGEVVPKDMVVMHGRWAYDGGHSGYNEIHAVRVLQKVYNVPTDTAGFEKFRQDWCRHLAQVPGVGIFDAPPSDPVQQEIDEAQRHPGNRWAFHPMVDGCRTDTEAEEFKPPIVK
jgi:hypothetical protein